MIVIFKPGDAGQNVPYYADGRQVIFEAGGPLSGFNLYLTNGKICAGMWNRFESKFMIYDPQNGNDIYPLDPDGIYIAQLEYDGTHFKVIVSKDGGSSLTSSGKITFQGLIRDNGADSGDKTGIGGAARTRYHDYSTGETYSDHYHGYLGDVILYNQYFDQNEGQAVYDFLTTRYNLDPVIYPMAKTFADDWRVYEFEEEENVEDQSVLLSQPHPNPFTHETFFAVNLTESQNISVELFDIQGSKMLTIHSGSLGKGIHDFVIDGNQLSSGVYLLKVTGMNFVKTKKVILKK